MLTGKFRSLAAAPKDVRGRNILFTPGRFERCMRVVEAVEKIGAKYGKTIAQTAIAWCIQSPYVTSAIVGARTPEQVAENAGGAGWRLDDEDFLAIETLGREAVADIDPNVNIWGDHANWGT
jgi:aryl-alcohol dehydrogenase-like predicted oxidoreductase